MALNAFESAAQLVGESFFYNRENFQYDREQRMMMEFQLANMRIEQVGLWREDVRDFSSLTPRKMEVYLLVTALELGFCVMALCKARVPPGAPAWLVSCHTLAVCGALMYLFLALWFGMHAFVSAQAYKVRILTQLVRLPVPTWQSLEASRTYSSAFEKLQKRQMLRVPFAMGWQEQHCQTQPGVPAGRSESGNGGSSPRSTSPVPEPRVSGAETRIAADPWGLERRGDGFAELAPDVNSQCERQRHIWLVREAAKFYQTYDAFCRISMSAGTSCLATFFCYYCMTYVLTENAAPTAAWAGMILFIGCALSLLRCDLMLSGWQYFVQGALSFASPALTFMVTYKSSKNAGHPGHWKCMIVIALFLHGVSLINYLVLFRVREMQTGAVLPTAFRRVLYIDPFGWAKHTGTWWKQMRAQLMLSRNFLSSMRSLSNLSLNSAGSDIDPSVGAALPTMQCVNSGMPKRPEEVEEYDPARAATAQGDADHVNISFRPRTFASHNMEEETPQEHGESIQTGTDIHGEKPGLVPWRIFFINTVALAFAWECAATVSFVRTVRGKSLFHPLKNATYGLRPGIVMPIPEMYGERVETRWQDGLYRPRGLACDPSGTQFLTSGRAADGSHGLLHGRLSLLSNQTLLAAFSSTLPCTNLPIQDLSLHDCAGRSGCSAMVLPRKGSQLVPCKLGENGSQLEPQAVGRKWLEDRGGVPLDGHPREPNLLYPEELSSMGSVPCSAQDSTECIVVGTTARRVVKLGSSTAGWVPKGLLRNDHGEVPEAGAFALLGTRYLGTLQRQGSFLQVLDLHQGGAHVGTWRLPGPRTQWASVCAGGGAFYALEDRQDPALWKFVVPRELSG